MSQPNAAARPAPSTPVPGVLALRPTANAAEYELLIYGAIGDSWWEASVTAQSVVEQLQALAPTVTTINVRINSFGGSVADGLAIHNALRRHPAAKVVTVDGVAMSSASLIAMCGDTVQMPATSIFMVHAPWGYLAGNAKELRIHADVLDQYSAAMADAYVRKSGKPREDILGLLTDGVDHYYTGAEAVAEGFADALIDAVDVDVDEQARAAAEAALARCAGLAGRSHDEQLARAATAMAMGNARAQRATPVSVPAPAPVAGASRPADASATPSEDPQMSDNPNPATATPAADAKAILAADRDRRNAIAARFAPFIAADATLAALQRECENDDACTVEVAATRLLDRIGASAAPLAGQPRVEAGSQDETATFREGMAAALSYRANPNGKMDERARDFAGMNLVDMAREACARAGLSVRGASRREIAVKALHSTSDFPLVLENVLTKSLRAAYEGTPRTFLPFCRRATLPDFKQVSRAQLGGAPNLKRVLEGAEYEQGTIGEGAEKYALSKYGRIVAITWETVVNDDLDAFTRVPSMFGRSAADLESDIVYAILTGNPLMADSVNLFDAAGHGNVGTTAALQNALDPSKANPLEEMYQLMMLQKGIEGRYITVRPEFLIVPPQLAATALKLTSAAFTPNRAADIDVIGSNLTAIVEPRLVDGGGSGTAFFGAANPNVVDTIEYAYLEGNEGVFTETRNGFEVDGLQVKCRHVFAAKAIDHRGLFKNAGASFPAG